MPMDQGEGLLAERLADAHHPRLRAVAHQDAGLLSDADDAVQEAWLRWSAASGQHRRRTTRRLANHGRRPACLHMLRLRAARREEPLGHLPDPVISQPDVLDPEQEALLADAVGLALLVVLDTLAPAERLAFVAHDTFAVPFNEIAAILGRFSRPPRASLPAALAAGSGVDRAAAGRRPRGPATRGRGLPRGRAQRRHGGAGRGLDPEVVVRADWGKMLARPHGPARCPRGGRAGAGVRPPCPIRAAGAGQRGAAGVVVAAGVRLIAVMGFTVTDGKITEIDISADPERLRHVDLTALGNRPG